MNIGKGLSGFFDRVVNPTNGLGQFGKALVMAGGSQLGNAFALMDRQREADRRERAAHGPKFQSLGDGQFGFVNPETGEVRVTYSVPKAPELTSFQKDLQAAGIDPASEEGRKLYRQRVEGMADPVMAVDGFDSAGNQTRTFYRRSELSGQSAPQGGEPIQAIEPPVGGVTPAKNHPGGFVPPRSLRFGAMTSGRRTEEGNRLVGGVPNSAHLRGNAVDYDGADLPALLGEVRGLPGVTKAFIHKGHVHTEGDGWNVPYFGSRGTTGLKGGTATIPSRSQPARQASGGTLRVGQKVGDYTYLGGNPKAPTSWKKG